MRYPILLASLLMGISCGKPEKEKTETEEAITPDQSKIYSADSGYTTGSTMNNKKSGWWKSFNAQNQLLSEELYDNNEQLMRERLITNGEVSSERMISDQGELVITYHPNGRIQSYGFYKTDSIPANKALTGDSRQFDKNGTQRLYSNFDHNRGIITEIEYDAAGKIWEERYYKTECPNCNQIPTGTWKKYIDGKLKETVKH